MRFVVALEIEPLGIRKTRVSLAEPRFLQFSELVECQTQRGVENEPLVVEGHGHDGVIAGDEPDRCPAVEAGLHVNRGLLADASVRLARRRSELVAVQIVPLRRGRPARHDVGS
ncbi:MAG: hypothetical protein ABI783_01005 [Actinomycetota bacterium]